MDADGGAIADLPEDMVIEILGRLRERSLARCRSVCKAWRATVDANDLLHLQRDFLGFFTNSVDCSGHWGSVGWDGGSNCSWPLFLSPPSARAPGVDRLAFLRPHLPIDGRRDAVVHDHCNGLVLCFQDEWSGCDAREAYVCNPATKRWAHLPQPPTTLWPRRHDGAFLAFDPDVSPHYEVFLLPVPPSPVRAPKGMTLDLFMPELPEEDRLDSTGKRAVPFRVFSSADGQWKLWQLAPGRCAPEHLYDTVTAQCRRRPRPELHEASARTWRSAAYCRGSLYVHCESHILVVLRCSEGTYDMVELPDDGNAGRGRARSGHRHVLSALPLDLVSSAPGNGAVWYASVDVCRVKIWELQEPKDDGGKLEWTLTSDEDLAAHARMLELLDDAPPNCMRSKSPDNDKATHGEDDADDVWSERWSWDDAMASTPNMETQAAAGGGCEATNSPPPLSILGFHPSKDVIFLAAGEFHVVAYHLGSSKMQYMGRASPKRAGDRVEGVFPYRPCFLDALPPPPSLYPLLKTPCKRRR